MTRRIVVTIDQIERAGMLRAEGMPAPWIAEDLGLPPATIRRIAPADPEGQREWLRSWGRIRAVPALLALHNEFSPANAHHRA
ncbi:MAG: hypothetical protein ABI566_03670 [Pseudolysinimonas sp.]